MKAPVALIATLAIALTFTASARADTDVVDFESGPPLETAVTDHYLSAAFVRFLHADFGFRPYRRSAPNQARSGSVAVDVGANVCEREAGAGVGCETAIGGTSGRLTRTASAVTVFAGLFVPPATPVSVTDMCTLPLELLRRVSWTGTSVVLPWSTANGPDGAVSEKSGSELAGYSIVRSSKPSAAPTTPVPSSLSSKYAMSAAALATWTGVVKPCWLIGIAAPVAATVPFAR